MTPFKDREEAGKKLALLLKEYKGLPDALILGLPRGGVITAGEIAKKLSLPLDVIIARKIGHPMNPEFAVGALSESGTPIITQGNVKELQPIIAQELQELERRKKLYRNHDLNLEDKIVILVDDGIATGLTLRAALQTIKDFGAIKTIVATPVLPEENLTKIASWCDKLIYLAAPEDFFAISQFYTSFPQTTDEEVILLLKTLGQK